MNYFRTKRILFYFLAVTSLPISANICHKTLEIQDAIKDELQALTKKQLDCHEIGTKELSQIKNLKVSYYPHLKSLKAGDLKGLVALENLDLSFNLLSSIPRDIETLEKLESN